VTGDELYEQKTPSHDKRGSKGGDGALADPGDPPTTRPESLDETRILCS
jgi:hypothetical protein